MESLLEQHFEEVDISALPKSAREIAETVLMAENAGFNNTFLALHSLLSKHDAIGHIDMHGPVNLETVDKN